VGVEIKQQALHRCDNTRCWNPDHIFDGTQSDNLIDSFKKGRSSLGGGRLKTHCKNGHEYNEQNTWFYKQKRGLNKVCKICSRNQRGIMGRTNSKPSQ
jgi:hypothetical protein